MILHIDMDAFYASIEQRENPQLRGKAVIVGGTPEGRGVVCAASYEARKFGVRSAMPAATAVRLCPHGEFLPTRMSLYAEVSGQIRDIMHRYTPLVEPLALDEAFLDVRPCRRLLGEPEAIGREIKETIRHELDLPASVGVAPNKFLAKLASDVEKPDGFVIVQPDHVQDFLDPLPIRRLWGVGQRGAERMEKIGVRTIGDVRRLPEQLLKQHFGEQADHFGRLSRGEDSRRVTPDRQAKSISHETTFSEDISDPQLLHGWIITLAEQVAWRLRRHDLRGSTVQLKLRFHDFRTITRSAKLPQRTNVTQQICVAACDLLDKVLETGGRPIRLLGVGLSGLQRGGETQGSLFDAEEASAQKHLDEAADAIREKFGGKSLRRASGLVKRKRDERG